MSTAVVEREPEHLEKLGRILRETGGKSREEIEQSIQREFGKESLDTQRAYANAVQAIQERKKK
jgi:hypothetical protein